MGGNGHGLGFLFLDQITEKPIMAALRMLKAGMNGKYLQKVASSMY